MLTSNHILFLDTVISPVKEPFIRIKEAKREGDQWKHVGDVMITKDKLNEVIKILKAVEENIEIYS